MANPKVQLFLLFSFLLLFTGTSFGQGVPEETAQFDFLVGKWDAHYSTTQADGSVYELKAIWQIKYILNGFALQDSREIFDLKGRSLGKGTMFRSYNTDNTQWEIVEITSWKPIYHHMTAKQHGENMIMYEEQEKGGQTVKGRRVFSQITKNSFRWDYEEWDSEKGKWESISLMKVKRIE